MTRQIFLTAIFLTLFSNIVFAQVKLPKGFRCVLGEGHANESYFTDGTYTFSSYPWGHEGIYGKEVTETIEKNYNNQLQFKKTNDGIYWATGKVDGGYFYILLIDDALQYTLSSKTNGSQFSYYSTWLLQQIRNNKKSGLDTYYTDFKGKSCFGMK
jgi:hypothetical protein